MELNVKVEISADQLREAVEQVASDVAREAVDERLDRDVQTAVDEYMGNVDPADYWTPRDIIGNLDIEASDIEDLTDYVQDVIADDADIIALKEDVATLVQTNEERKQVIAELTQANGILYEEVVRLKAVVKTLVDVVGRASTEISNLQVL